MKKKKKKQANLMIVAIFKIAFLLEELKVNIFDLITAYN
jgi:hypothetical protein